MSNFYLMSHAIIGSLLGLAGVWLFVDVLNAKEENQARIRIMSLIIAGLMWLAYLLGGYFYVVFYSVDKAFILKGIERARGDDASIAGHFSADNRL
jgi:hypothetical protein